jgi:hypothetical protein
VKFDSLLTKYPAADRTIPYWLKMNKFVEIDDVRGRLSIVENEKNYTAVRAVPESPVSPENSVSSML